MSVMRWLRSVSMNLSFYNSNVLKSKAFCNGFDKYCRMKSLAMRKFDSAPPNKDWFKLQ